MIFSIVFSASSVLIVWLYTCFLVSLVYRYFLDSASILLKLKHVRILGKRDLPLWLSIYGFGIFSV